MTKTPTHTPTPLGIREPFTDEEKRLNRIFITGKRTDGGQPTDEDFDFLELPYAPKGSPKHAMAEYVVRAVNSHQELVEVLKAIISAFWNDDKDPNGCYAKIKKVYAKEIERAEKALARAEKGE